VPYSTIRPAIFSASLLAAAGEVRASRTWTGLAGTGRMALIDHRDAAEAGLRVLTDPALWGAHFRLLPAAHGTSSGRLGQKPCTQWQQIVRDPYMLIRDLFCVDWWTLTPYDSTRADH
jgi:hypothetical protein